MDDYPRSRMPELNMFNRDDAVVFGVIGMSFYDLVEVT